MMMMSGMVSGVSMGPRVGESGFRRRRVVRAHGGHGKMAPADPNSFVQTELRAAAMKLHTRSQAPREGQAPEPRPSPVGNWAPGREDYLRFLVDSRAVYSAMDAVVAGEAALERFRGTGLERVEALDRDIAWFESEYSIKCPPVGEAGLAYVAFLEGLCAEGNLPAFLCHYYNQYFAHTAGGRMIGAKMSTDLLDGAELAFYQWPAGDVKDLLDAVRKSLDDVAAGWDREQKDACVAETPRSFQYSGSLLVYLRGPVPV